MARRRNRSPKVGGEGIQQKVKQPQRESPDPLATAQEKESWIRAKQIESMTVLNNLITFPVSSQILLLSLVLKKRPPPPKAAPSETSSSMETAKSHLSMRAPSPCLSRRLGAGRGRGQEQNKAVQQMRRPGQKAGEVEAKPGVPGPETGAIPKRQPPPPPPPESSCGESAVSSAAGGVGRGRGMVSVRFCMFVSVH